MGRKTVKKIAVLPGDGIGVDVTQEAVKIFSALTIPIELHYGDIGWACWQQHGNPVPEKTWQLIEACDVTLLGAITSMPKKEAQDALPHHLQGKHIEYLSPIIQLRQNLDLYANVRPCFNIKGDASPFNFCVIRENTEGLYAGFDYHPVPTELQPLIQAKPRWKNKNVEDISASLRLQTKEGLLRLYHFAFDYAEKHHFKRVTLADKPNVLRESAAFARECFETVANKYPHISADILNVDAVSLWLVRRPEEFGVIVAENMFGDILSDLGAGVMGGLGFAPSANIGQKGAYFEPVHGSAPRVDRQKANPSAMFLTIAMLLDYLGHTNAGVQIRKAVSQVVKAAKHVTYDLGGTATTAEMADAIIEAAINPKIEKSIAFLATGSELLNGQVLESNSQTNSKLLSEAGAEVKTKMIASDNKEEIKRALLYLLMDHDCVITMGGLGPTSDDNTRFAISEALRLPLALDQASLEHIKQRLMKFGLTLSDNNRKQALFPRASTVIKNDLGTANACHIKWQEKDIFMMPGPPKENVPLFEYHVMPYLAKAQYFKPKLKKSYLTLGLSEGNISQAIDTLCQNTPIECAYRWHYPYLEIKLVTDNNFQETLLAEIENLLRDHVVSYQGLTALEELATQLEHFTGTIQIEAAPEIKSLLSCFNNNKIFIAKEKRIINGLVFKLEVVWPQKHELVQVIELNVIGTKNDKPIYHHQIKTPKRESDVELYIQSYFAWQLTRFIHALKVQAHE